MSRFVDFHRVSGNFYPENSSSFCMVSVIFYQIYSTDVHSLWRSLLVIFIEIKYRESFHRIPKFHFERFFVISLFLPSLYFTIYPSNFVWKISHDYQYVLSPITESFLLAIHVFSSDTFERYFLTFFTQVIPIEITYRRIRSIGDSRRSTGGSRPTRWDSVSTMHFSRSPRRLVHTKGIRNCCCYVAPRGGHL